MPKWMYSYSNYKSGFGFAYPNSHRVRMWNRILSVSAVLNKTFFFRFLATRAPTSRHGVPPRAQILRLVHKIPPLSLRLHAKSNPCTPYPSPLTSLVCPIVAISELLMYVSCIFPQKLYVSCIFQFTNLYHTE